MGKETYRTVTLMVRDEELNLTCPVCGCEEFAEQNIVVQEPMKLLPTDVHYYVCHDCTHMIPFSNPKEKPQTAEEKAQSEVEQFEERFKNYSENKLRKIIEDDGYFDAARKAAKNLLAKK